MQLIGFNCEQSAHIDNALLSLFFQNAAGQF